MIDDSSTEQENSPIPSQAPDLDLIQGIPVKDPQAALRFCQNLALLLSRSSHLPLGMDRPETWYKPELADEPVPNISVILPVFCEQDNLHELYRRLTSVLEKTEQNFEIIFVDDGSYDGSAGILRSLAMTDKRLTVVELTRNFGHQVAISAGMDYARGQAVIIMDADLQDPPEVLPQFITKWREGYDVVYAIRQNRKESWWLRTSYAFFYRLLHKVASINIPLDAGDFCIMDKKVVEILTRMPERNRFLRGIRSWVGLNQIGLTYERQERHAGKPKYNFLLLFYLALDGLISFSYIPLRMISLGGFLVSLISIMMALGYTIQKITIGLNPPGFATTVVAIFFLAGIQLITIGVIGEYIGRIFEEVKQRPLYLVRQVIHTPAP